MYLIITLNLLFPQYLPVYTNICSYCFIQNTTVIKHSEREHLLVASISTMISKVLHKGVPIQ
jgi:hypothetical protein